MPNPPMPLDPERLVADPATSAGQLRLIAYYSPELRAEVAAHPNAYPGLLDWLVERGGPEVAAIVAARRAGVEPPPLAIDEGGAPEPEEGEGAAESESVEETSGPGADETGETRELDAGEDEASGLADEGPLDEAPAPEDPEGVEGEAAADPDAREDSGGEPEAPAFADPESEAPALDESSEEDPEELPQAADIEGPAAGGELPDLADEEPESVEETSGPGSDETEEIREIEADEDGEPEAEADEEAGSGDAAPLGSALVEAGHEEEPLPGETAAIPAIAGIDPEATALIPASGLPDRAPSDVETADSEAPVERRSILPAGLDAAASTGEDASVAAEHEGPSLPAPAPAFAPTGRPPLDDAPGEEAEDEAGPDAGLPRWLLIAGALLAALVLFLGAFEGFSALFAGGSGSSGASTAQSTSAARTSAPASPQAAPEAASQSEAAQSAPRIAYPAPAGAATMTRLRAPSGNIRCVLGTDEVTCRIDENRWNGTAFETCGGRSPGVLTATRRSSGTSCEEGEVGDAPEILAYGSSAVNGHSACTSTEDGMTCWNTVTGRSFALARGGWTTGSTGAIPPSAFTW